MHVALWLRCHFSQCNDKLPDKGTLRKDGLLAHSQGVICYEEDLLAGHILCAVKKQGPGEMTQQLGALAALPEVLSSVLSNHMVTDNHL